MQIKVLELLLNLKLVYIQQQLQEKEAIKGRGKILLQHATDFLEKSHDTILGRLAR